MAEFEIRTTVIVPCASNSFVQQLLIFFVFMGAMRIDFCVLL